MASSTLRAFLRLCPTLTVHGHPVLQTRNTSRLRSTAPRPALSKDIPIVHAVDPHDINPDDRPRVSVSVPLFERTEYHLASLSDLLQWREQSLRHVSSLGDTFVSEDGGPSENDLRREMDWLLDDAVRGYISYHQDATEKGVQQRCCWDEIQSRLQHEAPDVRASLAVVLRASLRFLSEGWKKRVEERWPFQYLVASAHWRDMVLTVQEGVLIPRPETEQLIDLAQAATEANPALAQGVWADLGTGSGAIAIAVQQLLRPPGHVIAVDASPVAVAVARANVTRCSLQVEYIYFVSGQQPPLFRILRANDAGF